MNNQRNIFLGDIHGKFNIIYNFINKFDIENTNIIQLGDFGIGFDILKEKRWLSLYHDQLLNKNVHIWAVRGNHDFKQYFENDPFEFTNIHLVPDYSVINLCNKNILFLGGAVSIDRKTRKINNNYWEDEIFIFDENKLKEFRNIDIVISHTSPNYCIPNNAYGFGTLIEYMIEKYNDNTLKDELINERNQFDKAFEILKENNNIKYHYYGHFHDSGVIEQDGIKHRLLNVNEFYEEIDNL